jgi:hypothetical protein
VLATILVAGCGAQTAGRNAPKIERTFTVDWHDHATSLAVSYVTHRLVFHDGRWSADVTIRNRSDKPLYETVWAADNVGFQWNGPALVYSGLDVLGNRRLIYVPADDERPELPFPLRPGQSWHGTLSGKVPSKPALPRRSDIWLRFPVFGIGQKWNSFDNAALAVQVISEQGVQL